MIFDFIDPVLRLLGWLIALAVAVGAVTFALAVAVTPVRGLLERGGFYFLLGGCLAAPIWAGVLFLLWRALRFAGGYTGASEFPFQHVLRFFQ